MTASEGWCIACDIGNGNHDCVVASNTVVQVGSSIIATHTLLLLKKSALIGRSCLIVCRDLSGYSMSHGHLHTVAQGFQPLQ